MKITNGKDHLELERKKASLEIQLEMAQLKEEAFSEISEKIKVTEGEEGWLLSYPVSEQARSFNTEIQKKQSRFEKLKLAQKLSTLSQLENQFELPLLHPENIFLDGERLFVVHFGLRHLMIPFELTSEEFLTAYKALIFYIFNPKNSFETLLSSPYTGNDKLLKSIASSESIAEIVLLLDNASQKEAARFQKTFISVPKGNYRFFKYAGIFSILLTLALIFVTFSYYNNSKKQEAIISAQSSFLTQNYAQTQTELASYSPSDLPKAARYILAVSSVNLSNLTLEQKQMILNTLSTKSDDNTLNYWLYTGRGDFDNALDLAKNLGDHQLTLLAYMNLYESTKLDSKMEGAKKQELLDEYNKNIEEFTKSLTETGEE